MPELPRDPDARSSQLAAHGTKSARSTAALARSIRKALAEYLDGRELAQLKIRQVEGNSIEGFLKIDGGESERLLLDFRATSAARGRLSTLEVGGRKINIAPSASAKR